MIRMKKQTLTTVATTLTVDASEGAVHLQMTIMIRDIPLYQICNFLNIVKKGGGEPILKNTDIGMAF